MLGECGDFHGSNPFRSRTWNFEVPLFAQLKGHELDLKCSAVGRFRRLNKRGIAASEVTELSSRSHSFAVTREDSAICTKAARYREREPFFWSHERENWEVFGPRSQWKVTAVDQPVKLSDGALREPGHSNATVGQRRSCFWCPARRISNRSPTGLAQVRRRVGWKEELSQPWSLQNPSFLLEARA